MIDHIPNSNADIGTLKYSPQGVMLWLSRYNGPSGDKEYIHPLSHAITLDKDENIYVTGTSVRSGHAEDFLLIKHTRCNGVVPLAGDADANGYHSLADVLSAANYIFGRPGYRICPSSSNLCWLSDLLCRGDWNGDNSVGLTDIIRGVNYIFNKPSGPWNPFPSGTCCLAIP